MESKKNGIQAYDEGEPVALVYSEAWHPSPSFQVMQKDGTRIVSTSGPSDLRRKLERNGMFPSIVIFLTREDIQNLVLGAHTVRPFTPEEQYAFLFGRLKRSEDAPPCDGCGKE